MDRYDEKKTGAEEEMRGGDVLGLGGSAVPKMPGDPSASNDPESVRHRRERAMEEDEDTSVRRDNPYKQGHGATGIDMGAGGRGTDISGD